MREIIVAPSILSANFGNLQEDFKMLNESVASYIHIDVMDGVFVPNISLGIPVIEAMRKLSNKFFDVHLMIVNPENYIEAFCQAGANGLTLHLEASTHLHRSLQKIKNLGMQAGVALNPHTAVHQLADIITEIDLVCLMSVNPGFGGQSFIETTYAKIATLKELIIQKNTNTKIEIDGGVSLNNASKLIAAGADVLVAGNAIFKSENPLDTIHQLASIS